MGLFSRLKQAFSQPESTESAAASAADSSATSTAASDAVTPVSSQAMTVSADSTTVSEAVSATTSSATTVTSTVASAAETVDQTSQDTSQAPVSDSAAVVTDATSTAETDDQQATSAVTSHSMTATESMAARIKSAQASVASANASMSAPTSVTSAAENPAESTTTVTSATAVEPESAPTSAAEPEPTEAERYDEGLKKSRKTFGDRINAFLANFRHVDEAFFDDLEDTLIESDVGYETAMQISEELRDEVKLKNAKNKKEISSVIVEKLVDMYGEAGEGEDNTIHLAETGPTVILFVGVNGAGKTTTIGKMANMYKQQGKKVLLAACDTFRAGAIQQLQVWGQRDGVDVVAGAEKSDPASVCFDAVKKAKAEDYDILFVDTAGRLQNKVNLMNELEKIKRVITREIPAAPQEVLLVLDATTGQNALNQAKLFKQSTAVTGIILTKLDGTARGGIVLAIRNELHLAVKYVGLGEKVTDLRPFNANDFVYGLFKDVITA